MKDKQQFELFAPPPQRTPEAFWQHLNAEVGHPVSVTLTRNRVTMLSVSFVRDGYIRLRLHEAFLQAPDSIVADLVKYLRTRRRAYWDRVATFARDIATTNGAAHATRAARRKSRVHDLRRIAREVNRRFFSNRVRCRVEWGRERARRQRRTRSRSIRFGSWVATTRTIRVHPLLDDERVPREFVEYIVFHEMLHAVVPSRTESGRRCDHPPEFKKLEEAFPDQARMKRLSRELLDELL